MSQLTINKLNKQLFDYRRYIVFSIYHDGFKVFFRTLGFAMEFNEFNMHNLNLVLFMFNKVHPVDEANSETYEQQDLNNIASIIENFIDEEMKPL